MRLTSFPEPQRPMWHRAASVVKRLALLRKATSLIRSELGQDAVYLGEGESLPYLESLHQCPVKTTHLSPQELLGAARNRPRRAVTYIELNRLVGPLVLPTGGWFTLPWIRQRVHLTGPLAGKESRSVKEVYGRRVRRYGYRYALTTDQGLVERFHRELYLPYVAERHQGDVHFRGLEELMAASRSGFLLQVFEGDSWVSGAICILRPPVVTLLASGLLGDYGRLLRRGALSSVYYFLIAWAKEHSLDIVDLMRTRPHVDGGVFVHKQRFGAVATTDAWPHTGIWIYPPKGGDLPPPTRGLLVQSGEALVPLSTVLTR